MSSRPAAETQTPATLQPTSDTQGPSLPDFVVFIPARLASTRLPDKPLADLGGIPVVVRAAMQAAQSGASRVVVATESSRVAEVVHRAGFEAVMTAASHVSGTDRLAEAVGRCGLAAGQIVVNVQGDEPEMPPALINAVAQALHDDVTAQMSTAAHPIERADDWLNPNVVKVVVDARGRALYFSRAPIPWNRDRPVPQNGESLSGGDATQAPLRHIGIYGYRADYLARFAALPPSPLEAIESLEQLRALHHGHGIAVRIADAAPPSGIDTPADLEAARQRLATAAVASDHPLR